MPDTYTSASPGHMFVIRNAGNFVPHARLFGSLGHTYSEHAALELAVAKSDVKHVAVCGHSNCKVFSFFHTQVLSYGFLGIVAGWVNTHLLPLRSLGIWHHK